MTGHVLVVEDDTLLREVISDYLRSQGCTVDGAGTVRAMRAALGANDYDAVVTDIHLPDGDTTGAIHEMRAERPDLPVVFITGDVNNAVAQGALAEDPTAFIIKPFEFSELGATVAHALRSSDRDRLAEDEAWPERGRNIETPIVLLTRPPGTDHSRGLPPRLAIRMTLAVSALLLGAFLIGHFLAKPHVDSGIGPVTGSDKVLIVPVQPATSPAASSP